MSIILIIILILIIVFFLADKAITSISFKEIKSSLQFILDNDTNGIVTVSSHSRRIQSFVKELNDYLKTLRQKEIKYQKHTSALEELITNMTHDIRTPLTVIKGYIELLEVDKKYNEEYFQIMMKKTNELVNLTDDLFLYCKTNNLNKDYKENILVNSVLEDTLLNFYPLIKDKKLEVKVNITTAKIRVLVNEDLLVRVLDNVFSNAIKYSKTFLLISLDDNGVIKISNDATNLNSVNVSKLFDKYYTVNSGSKSRGLGLAIARSLIEMTGGMMTCDLKNNVLTMIIHLKK